MEETLKSRFREAQLASATLIGAQVAQLRQKVDDLFQTLGDPLLSAKEVRALLGISDEIENVVAALEELVADSRLEKSDKTSRPLDPKTPVALYRRTDVAPTRLKLYAVASKLPDGTYRFQFTVDGRLIRSIARVDRLDSVAGDGNQRDEIIKHVKEIAKGISDGTQVPNSVLIVFDAAFFAADPPADEPVPNSWIICKSLTDDSLITLPNDQTQVVQAVKTVEIDLPFRFAAFDDEKSALLVDGQQRTAALSLVDIDKVPNFPLSVNAVVAPSEDGKKIFQVANNTVRISTEFSRALLSTMEEAPGYLKSEQLRAKAVKRLALSDQNSPFNKLVKMPGADMKKAPIAYNSLFAIVTAFDESPLEFNGDPNKLAECVSRGFSIVKQTWPNAWGKTPSESRLMHGAGLRAVANVLTQLIANNVRAHGFELSHSAVWTETAQSLARLATRIQWTAEEALTGTKEQKKIFTDEISSAQNTSQDIQALSTFLMKECTYLDKLATKGAKTT